MFDVHNKKTRSYNMSQVKGKNTKPEILVRKYLFSLGFRYRLNDRKLPGKPDIVLSKFKIVIFINGCFWHGHTNCGYATIPQTRTVWWQKKIEGNKDNDIRASKALKKLGFRVINIWTCDLKPKKVEKTLKSLVVKLKRLS